MANTMISKMAESWIIDDDVSLSDDESATAGDLSSWELINPSDDDDDETLAFSFSSSSEEDRNDAVSVPESLSSEISLESPPKKLAKKLPVRLLNRFGYSHSFNYYYDRDADVDGGDEEGDEYDSSDGLDDELVPRSVSDRFGRNRMRKLGKREYSRMARSKKLPVVYNRPGCVHGKHGLGLKHSLI